MTDGKKDAKGLATMSIPEFRDAVAPDGSDVRILLSLSGGGLAQFSLAGGHTAVAVRHHTVEEIWVFTAGNGEMWRRDAGGIDETVPVHAGVCLTIPVGTTFQFRSFGSEPLTAIGVTMPPWPGRGEAVLSEGPWEPTVPPGPT